MGVRFALTPRFARRSLRSALASIGARFDRRSLRSALVHRVVHLGEVHDEEKHDEGGLHAGSEDDGGRDGIREHFRKLVADGGVSRGAVHVVEDLEEESDEAANDEVGGEREEHVAAIWCDLGGVRIARIADILTVGSALFLLPSDDAAKNSVRISLLLLPPVHHAYQLRSTRSILSVGRSTVLLIREERSVTDRAVDGGSVWGHGDN